MVSERRSLSIRFFEWVATNRLLLKQSIKSVCSMSHGPWVMVLHKIIMVTNPESFMKIRTIQKLDRFYKSVVVKSDWLLLCQLSKKIIETMSNHSWNRKCPTKWRISYKSISNATLFKKTNLDHEFHWLKMNFEFDWKCFDIDEKLVVMMQSLRTKVRMSFYWNTF